MSLVILAAYAVGILLGSWAGRHPRMAAVWPRYVRAQLLLAAVVLSVLAAWRLTAVADVVWPVLIIGVYAAILVLSLLITRGERRLGIGTLRAWTATSNTGFFTIPFTAAFGGPAALAVAVLVDRFGMPVWATYVHLLRRDAPIKQRMQTSFIDQAPLIALVVGLALHLVGPAPAWTGPVSLAMAPVFAMTGSAVFVGSILHPSQKIDPRPGVWPWARLILVRTVLLGAIILAAPNDDVRLVAVLGALSIPAFGPSRMSTVYGYREPAVAASIRYAWWLGGLGVIAGWWLTHR